MITKDRLQCRRLGLATPGGSVVLGDGPMPFFMGSHLLNKGYYYCVRINAIDEDWPGDSGVSLALGVSRLSAREKKLQGSNCPLYAYEIPGVVLLGYGSTWVDERKWYHSPWGTSGLSAGDTIGVL